MQRTTLCSQPLFMRLLAVGLLVLAQPVLAASLTIHDAWARATPPGAVTAAAYFSVRNDGADDDRLIEIRSDAATKVELHTTVNEGGLMKMMPLDGLLVPAGATATLAPGGSHLMFMGLRGPFEPGATVEVTLKFERAGERKLVIPVRDARLKHE